MNTIDQGYGTPQLDLSLHWHACLMVQCVCVYLCIRCSIACMEKKVLVTYGVPAPKHYNELSRKKWHINELKQIK